MNAMLINAVGNFTEDELRSIIGMINKHSNLDLELIPIYKEDIDTAFRAGALNDWSKPE